MMVQPIAILCKRRLKPQQVVYGTSKRSLSSTRTQHGLLFNWEFMEVDSQDITLIRSRQPIPTPRLVRSTLIPMQIPIHNAWRIIRRARVIQTKSLTLSSTNRMVIVYNHY